MQWDLWFCHSIGTGRKKAAAFTCGCTDEKRKRKKYYHHTVYIINVNNQLR